MWSQKKFPFPFGEVIKSANEELIERERERERERESYLNTDQILRYETNGLFCNIHVCM